MSDRFRTESMKLDRKKIATLLEEGARPDSLIVNGKNALIEAVRLRDVVLVELLVSHGSDINMRTAEGETPLQLAVETLNPVMLLLLLSSGADVNGRILNGRTPLFTAIELGRRDVVELLIARGADVNARSHQGFTPLHIAVCEERKDMISMLLAHGARPDAQASDGETPISLAVNGGNLAIVRKLGGMALYNEKMASRKAVRRNQPALLFDAARTTAKALFSDNITVNYSDEAISLHDRVKNLLAAVQDEIDHVTRYVDMGAINASDAEIESSGWKEYYDRWRILNGMSRTSPCSEEIKDMLRSVEIMLATHRPEDCDCHVEKSGLELKK
jgi:hypothetical protein